VGLEKEVVLFNKESVRDERMLTQRERMRCVVMVSFNIYEDIIVILLIFKSTLTQKKLG